jgi:hypothetical protein
VIDGNYLTIWTDRQPGDLTEDGRVNLEDASSLSSIWSQQDCAMNLRDDLNGDCIVDLSDLLIMSGYWLYD